MLLGGSMNGTGSTTGAAGSMNGTGSTTGAAGSMNGTGSTTGAAGSMNGTGSTTGAAGSMTGTGSTTGAAGSMNGTTSSTGAAVVILSSSTSNLRSWHARISLSEYSLEITTSLTDPPRNTMAPRHIVVWLVFVTFARMHPPCVNEMNLLGVEGRGPVRGPALVCVGSAYGSTGVAWSR